MGTLAAYASNRLETPNTAHNRPASPTFPLALAALACDGVTDADGGALVGEGVTYAKLVTVDGPTLPPPPGVGVPVATRIEVGTDMVVSKVEMVVLM